MIETTSAWCIIINQRRCKSKAWTKWQSLLDKNEITYSLHFTNSISELSDTIAELLAMGNRYFLFAGGDGTVHHGGNLLIYHAEERSKEIVFGVLPCGTGNDWVRTFGIDKKNMVESLRGHTSTPHHVLKLEWPDGTKRYAMNMLGGAIDAEVVDTLNTKDYPIAGFLKYPIALLKTLMKPHKWHAIIKVDEKEFTDDWLTVEAGFGKYCGGGMYVLPHAKENEPGLLLMKSKSFFRILSSLSKIYNGKIGQQSEAITMHFSTLEILASNYPIPLEADGEWLGYGPVVITPVYGAMQRLVN